MSDGKLEKRVEPKPCREAVAEEDDFGTRLGCWLCGGRDGPASGKDWAGGTDGVGATQADHIAHTTNKHKERNDLRT